VHLSLTTNYQFILFKTVNGPFFGSVGKRISGLGSTEVAIDQCNKNETSVTVKTSQPQRRLSVIPMEAIRAIKETTGSLTAKSSKNSRSNVCLIVQLLRLKFGVDVDNIFNYSWYLTLNNTKSCFSLECFGQLCLEP
jgi:hypothetical protein